MMAFHPRKLLLQVQICIGHTCAPRHPSFSPPLPPPPPRPTRNPLFNQTNQNNDNLSVIMIFMLCALSAALFLLLLGYLICVKKCNSQRRSHESTFDDEHFVDENHGLELDHPIIWYINSSVGLQQSVIDSIAVFKYKRDDGMIEGTDCSVCLNEFQEDDTLRLLPKCNHAYHIPCIDTWLSSNETCPLCRAPIVTNSSPLNSVESYSNDLEENLENCGEVGSTQVGEFETNEISIGAETNIESWVLSDSANHCSKVEEETVRRSSVSMDLAYASRMCPAVANNIPLVELEGCSTTQLVELKKPNSEVVAKRLNKNSSIYRLMRSSSFGRYLQKRPIAMKRSFSSSGKYQFSSTRRFSRSQDTILPLR